MANGPLSSRNNFSRVTCFLTKSIKFKLYICVYVQYVHYIQERQENCDTHVLQIFMFSIMKTDTEVYQPSFYK